MGLTFTATGAARPVAEGVEVPVVGGLLTVACDEREARRLLDGCVDGARVTARVRDQGDGWWLATAARVEGGLEGGPGDVVD